MKNTKNALLMSVAAAAMIAGAGVAFAQAPSAAPAAQQNAPAEKMAPVQKPKDASNNKAPDAAMKSDKGVVEKTDRSGGKVQAQDNTKNDLKAKSTTSETKLPSKTSSETKSPGKTSSEMKADTKTKADIKSSEKAGTTGQGAAAGSANLSTEQRTTIRTVIKQQNVQPVTNVNFSISVGARVPGTVHFYRLPVELVRIYPRWRGYDYFLIGDQIIVVNPRTHMIVAVLEA